MKFVVVSLMTLVSAVTFADSSPRGCLERVRQAGCYVSGFDMHEGVRNVEKCRHFESKQGSTELEVFLMKHSNKLVVVKTAGSQVRKPNCPMTRYTVDAAGMDDFKVIGNHLFALSNDGQLYMMLADQTFAEIMNSRGRPYSGIRDIKGSRSGHDSIVLIGRTFETELTIRDIQNRVKHPVRFEHYTTRQSLFSVY